MSSDSEVQAAQRRALGTRTDQWEVQHYEMAEAFTRIVREEIGSVKIELKNHIDDQYAHPNANKSDRDHLNKLWDERNENKGMLRILAFSIPIASVISPIVAVLITINIKHG